MAKIISLPGLIHFEYQSRNHVTMHVAHEKGFKDFLKLKKLSLSRDGLFFRKGKDGVDISRSAGRVVKWGRVKKFMTLSASARKRGV